MRNLAVVLLGFFLLALLSPLLYELGVARYVPDLVLCMTIYLGLTSSFGRGLGVALLLGLLKDGFSLGSPVGMYMEIGAIAYLVSFRLSRRLVLRGPVGAMLVSFVFSLGASIVELVLSLVFVRDFGDGESGPGLILVSMIPQALMTAPFGIIVFWLMDRLDALTTRKTDSVFL
ncbi:MAG: rod shape-determining protein MreD [Myxococcales bacterium]|nr:rod shape-determining protein MreD [Myxococcales bacterium]MCB9736756.1 rod shape-determining protein MreD [Deltaproteobacteria bacterium]